MKNKVLAIVSFVMVMSIVVCCHKNEEEPESDIIVKEFSSKNALTKWRDKDTIYFDVNSDGVNDIYARLEKASAHGYWNIIAPINNQMSFYALDNVLKRFSFGDTIIEDTNNAQWKNKNAYSEYVWLLSQENTYFMYKIESESGTNYGWVLPYSEELFCDTCSFDSWILYVQETGCCIIPEKKIYAGQKE